MAKTDSQTQGAKFFSFEDLLTTVWVLKNLEQHQSTYFPRLCDHEEKTQLIRVQIIDSESAI